ncbi:MAG: response regulator transcription factor [Nanoarchaeota archaeon]|nr:response regulator transcription factor [Nanoarchaeota archaeon]
MANRILIIEDDKDARLLISKILGAEKFDVVAVSNGTDAISAMKKGGIDLILLDIMMPRMDGLHTAHEIRKFSKVPIIVVSVKDDQMTKDMAKKLYKVDEYITKPFPNSQLIGSVKKALKMNATSKIDATSKTKAPKAKSGSKKK